MTRDVFDRFPKIGYVGVCATGFNVVDIDAAREHEVVVTNIPSYSTDSVTQFTCNVRARHRDVRSQEKRGLITER